jgi:hypothetical protein
MEIARSLVFLEKSFGLLASSIVLSGLVGCSSLPNQAETSTGPTPPRQGYASLYIGRPSGPNVSHFSLPIEIDGKSVISLAPGQYTAVELVPGKHTISVPDEYWNRVIAGTAHPAEFAVESEKRYYALPANWYADAGYQTSVVRSVAVSERVALPHNSFEIRPAAANAGSPAEFGQLTYVKAN